MKRIIFSLVLLLVFSLSSGCQKPESHEEEEEHGHAPEDIIMVNQEAVKGAGIQTFIVQEKLSTEQIKTTGQIKVDENNRFHISSLTTGRVVKDNAFIGDYVRPGQTLAVIQNPEVAKVHAEFIHEYHQNEIDVQQAKSRLDLARKNLEREKKLYDEGISPRKDYQQALTDVQLAQNELTGQKEHAIHIQSEAKALLNTYGGRVKSMESEKVSSTSTIVASHGGLVTQKSITIGDVVSPENVLYEVVDLSRVWLDITVYPNDIGRVHEGQTVSFDTDSLPGQVFLGSINYIQPIKPEEHQPFIARAVLGNTQARLKPGMLGHVGIHQHKQITKPFLPEVAVQTYGKEKFVFLVLGKGKYKKQVVQLGERVDDGYIVDAGVQVGDKIVGKGSFTLKAEMLKSQFEESGHGH